MIKTVMTVTVYTEEDATDGYGRPLPPLEAVLPRMLERSCGIFMGVEAVLVSTETVPDDD